MQVQIQSIQGRAWNSVPNELLGPAEVTGLLTSLWEDHGAQEIF